VVPGKPPCFTPVMTPLGAACKNELLKLVSLMLAAPGKAESSGSTFDKTITSI